MTDQASTRQTKAGAGQDAPDSKLSDAASVRVSTRAASIPASKILQRVILPRDSDPLDVRPLYRLCLVGCLQLFRSVLPQQFMDIIASRSIQTHQGLIDQPGQHLQ